LSTVFLSPRQAKYVRAQKSISPSMTFISEVLFPLV